MAEVVSNLDVMRDLARAKAVFQQRAILAVIMDRGSGAEAFQFIPASAVEPRTLAGGRGGTRPPLQARSDFLSLHERSK